MAGVDTPMGEGDASSPLDFSLTPSQFGISTQSFTPVSSSHKDKSRLAQLKKRRMSSIGVRGSPEMNSLIRFMAKQRLNTPPTPQTPLDRGSSLLPNVSSTLKQKIASFQTLMNVEDCDSYNTTQKENKDTGGDERSPVGGKENCPPPVKRRCTAPLKECVEEIREASAPILGRTSVVEKREIEGRALLVDTQGPKPLNETVKKSFFKPIRLNSESHMIFSDLQARPLKSWIPHETREPPFEVQSLSRPLPEAAAAVPGVLPTPPSPHCSMLKSTAKSDSSETDDAEANPKRKRCVHFGMPLSPEVFDRNFPPSTPLKKGATPARSATPGDRLRPALKTPQRSEPRLATPSAQPDLGSPLDLGASPILSYSLTRRRKVSCPEEDGVETCEKISFPSLDEMDNVLTEKTDGMSEAQPLNLNAAFQEESLADTGTRDDSVPEPQAVPCAASEIEMQEGFKAHPQPEAENVVELPAPACSTTRKRKVSCLQGGSDQPAHSFCGNQPEDSGEPVKRLMRSAAKAATGKMKAASNRRWSKEVDLSLYGSRLYASKDPILSPIRETLKGGLSSLHTASDEESTLSLPTEAEFLNSDPITGVLTAATEQHDCSSANNKTVETEDISPTDQLEKPSEDPVEIFTPRIGKLTRKNRSWSMPSSNAMLAVKSNRVKGRGGKGKKVSVPVDPWLSGEPQSPPQTESTGHEHGENHATINHLATESLSRRSVPENKEVCNSEQCPQISVLDAQCTERGNNEECHTSLNEPVDTCIDVEMANPVSMSAFTHQTPVQRLVGNDLILQEGKVAANQTEEYKLVQGETVPPANPPTSQLDLSSSDNQPANPHLAPWQADFNVEDVFKPITSRGQRSVRRSLRNRSKVNLSDTCRESSSGMAWVPQTSPDSIRMLRRRSRKLHSTVSHLSDVTPSSCSS